MRRRVEFGDEDLAQFPPQVQEALMRLYRQQSAPPPPDYPSPAPIGKFPDAAAEEKKMRAQHGRDGTVSIPALFGGLLERDS